MSKREVVRVASEIQQVAWGVCVAAGQGVARLGKPLAVFLIALLVQASAFGQQSTQTFFFEGDVFQTYTASASGWYFLDVSGAQGGPAGSGTGGLGARMQGYVHLQAGETLRIAVGGAGQVGQWKGNNPSGGGGTHYGSGGSPLLSYGGQAYLSGNYGGNGLPTSTGG